ncbi:hypothetical protein OYC64_011299 [Pagothenia borchgrevinki]|uniref:Uncharacterized protein n=1 Tax=Pagothenia borchgrevinki TaxID=8213 RepID=A0ABD2H075_PAGBO
MPNMVKGEERPNVSNQHILKITPAVTPLHRTHPDLPPFFHSTPRLLLFSFLEFLESSTVQVSGNAGNVLPNSKDCGWTQTTSSLFCLST